MSIPSRSDYRYVSVPSDILIDRQIMPQRSGPEKYNLRGEDICFLEEARCERVGMSGGVPSASSITESITTSQASAIASGIASVYASPFLMDLDDADWINTSSHLVLPDWNSRSKAIQWLYHEGIYLSGSRSSTAYFTDSINAEEVQKMFDDISDMKAIADIGGTHCTINRTTFTYHNSTTPEQTFVYPYTSWNLSSDRFYSIESSGWTQIYNSGTFFWRNSARSYPTINGPITLTPMTDWKMIGVLALRMVFVDNTHRQNIAYLNMWCKAKYFPANSDGSSVTIPQSFLGSFSDDERDLGLVGFSEERIPHNIPYIDIPDGQSSYSENMGFNCVPVVAPSDFRTDISN